MHNLQVSVIDSRLYRDYLHREIREQNRTEWSVGRSGRLDRAKNAQAIYYCYAVALTNLRCMRSVCLAILTLLLVLFIPYHCEFCLQVLILILLCVATSRLLAPSFCSVFFSLGRLHFIDSPML